MADEPAPKKSNLVKLMIGLALAMAGYGGADAAGFQFDPEMLSQFGGFALIVYLELRIRPLLVVIANGLPVDLTAEAEPEAAPVVVPDVPTGRMPRIAVVRPSSVNDE